MGMGSNGYSPSLFTINNPQNERKKTMYPLYHNPEKQKKYPIDLEIIRDVLGDIYGKTEEEFFARKVGLTGHTIYTSAQVLTAFLLNNLSLKDTKEYLDGYSATAWRVNQIAKVEGHVKSLYALAKSLRRNVPWFNTTFADMLAIPEDGRDNTMTRLLVANRICNEMLDEHGTVAAAAAFASVDEETINYWLNN
jgi:UDP-galactopyranose mutase